MIATTTRRGLGILLAAALLSTASAAAADVPPEDKVYPRNLPSHAQAAKIYDGLDGGYREVRRYRFLQVRSADCLAWDEGPKARSGRWAAYYGKGGSNPYFEGLPSPGVFVYKFASLHDARYAHRAVFEATRNCFGTHSDSDITVESHEIEIPDVGHQRFAYREHVTSNGSEDYFLYAWVLQGRYVTETMVQAEPSPPDKGQAVRLTRRTLERIP